MPLLCFFYGYFSFCCDNSISANLYAYLIQSPWFLLPPIFRAPEKALNSRASAKRGNNQIVSRQGEAVGLCLAAACLRCQLSVIFIGHVRFICKLIFKWWSLHLYFDWALKWFLSMQMNLIAAHQIRTITVWQWRGSGLSWKSEVFHPKEGRQVYSLCLSGLDVFAF